MTLQQTLLKEDGSTACIGDLTFGLFDLQLRKLIEPPTVWLNLVENQLTESMG